jgi:hypothetical protein
MGRYAVESFTTHPPFRGKEPFGEQKGGSV